MFLYLLTQTENTGYDTYDSCVVVASSASEARRINPRGLKWDEAGRNEAWGGSFLAYWASHPDKVCVDYLGWADESIDPGVVLASFNAG